MWLPAKSHAEKRAGENGLVAVAIDNDKGSHFALKWAIENLLIKGQTVILIHVMHKPSSHSAGNHAHIHDINNAAASTPKHQLDKQTKDLFRNFRCFCARKDIHILDVILEDLDIAKALTEYASYAAIENMVLGAPSRHGFIRRFKMSDIPSSVSKGAPDFCTVYVISKGKISSVRNASRSAPHISPLYNQIHNQDHNTASHASSHSVHGSAHSGHASVHSGHATVHSGHASSHPGHTNSHSGFPSIHSAHASPRSGHAISLREDRTPYNLDNHSESKESIKSPFARQGRGFNDKMFGDVSELDDISFVSGGRPSVDRMPSSFYDTMDLDRTSRLSTSSDRSCGSIRYGTKLMDQGSMHDFSSVSRESACSSENMDDMEAEMRRLKLELKQTMDLYSTACKEALTAKQKAVELHRWRLEEEQRLEEARIAEENALAMAERERLKCRRAIEKAEAAQRIAELEAHKRMNAEMKARKESEEMRKAMDAIAHQDVRYRRYTIEEVEVATDFFSKSRKIGEGGYGPVYKCHLDHTPVAVKVLRPDAAQGRSQFQQEVEVLSCIRHPNMVLLLGACPEYGCLVYEFMANGSLEDRLFRIGNTPVLPWQLRFRIAAEIATGLLFLHQTKPEPLVHRDLKPGNILLDRNYVSKISDVGLARLVPPSVADNVTQYRMTSTAGTFCYIDPEYQQTGMLGIKSDIYSLGIMLLQVITSKQPMGLTHHVEQSIEKGNFAEMLDPAVPDWPVEEALCLAKVALQCAELRRKDRPDLDSVVLPELERLRALAEQNMHPIMLGGSACPSPIHSQISISEDVIQSGYDSAKSRSSISSLTGKK